MRDARFLAIETKADGGRLSDDQEKFLEHLASHGGVAIVPTNALELLAALDAASRPGVKGYRFISPALKSKIFFSDDGRRPAGPARPAVWP